MPYFIQKRDSEYCVMQGTKENPGETKKCHPTKDEAVDHMQALYVHVEDAKARGEGQGQNGERQGDGGPSVCTCPKCGETVPHKQNVACSTIKCPKCGAVMRGDKATVTDAVTTNMPHGEGGYLPDSGAGRECPKCGADISENAKKCPKCGAKLKGGIMDIEQMVALKTVKSLGDGRLGGYLILWGDESRKDLVGEHFTPETDLWLGVWKTIPMVYHHGMNEAEDLRGRKSVVGDWDKFKKDDIGLWVEGELDKRHKYKEAIEQLIATPGKAPALSSGAWPSHVDVAENGHITSWPIIDGSLTPMPMEYRMADIAFLKSACEIDLDVERIRKEVLMNTQEELLDKDEKSFLDTLFEKLGLIKQEPEAEVEKAKDTEKDEDDDDEEDDDDDEKKKKDKKDLDMKTLEPVIDSVIKAVTEQVGAFMVKAQEDLKMTLNSELSEIRQELSDFNSRLEGTEKSIEEKVAEKLGNLPEIVRAPVTETDATVRDGEEPIKGDKKQVNAWLESMVMPMVDSALREFTPRPFLDVGE